MALRIMLVEDEHMIALDLQDVLQEGGHTVVGHAVNLKEALAIAAKRKPQVAIVDIGLGGDHNGLEVARSLGAVYGVPALFLTGDGGFYVRAMALDVEPLGYITKPYQHSDVLQALGNWS